MIVEEFIGDRAWHRPDIDMKIQQIETGILYDDAMDVPNKYTYEETNIPVENNDVSAKEV